MKQSEFEPGDWVIYRKTKFSTHPGPRAENIAPALKGDEYAYTVDKFWIVVGRSESGKIVLRTRRGKQHTIEEDAPQLRKANLWERWRYRSRFLAITNATDSADADEGPEASGDDSSQKGSPGPEEDTHGPDS